MESFQLRVDNNFTSLESPVTTGTSNFVPGMLDTEYVRLPLTVVQEADPVTTVLYPLRSHALGSSTVSSYAET
jgi:hypothetical protein